LTIRILNKFFWFRSLVHSPVQKKYGFDEGAQNIIKDHEEKDE
jgi:hypothetical protein